MTKPKKTKGTKIIEWRKRAREGGTCERCKREVPTLTVDHIIPAHLLRLLDITGQAEYEDEDNFQMYCKPCNTFKGMSVDILNPKTIKLLDKYLEPFRS